MPPATPTTRKRPAPRAKAPAEAPPTPPEPSVAEPAVPIEDLGLVIPKSDGSQPAAPPPETIPVFTYDGTTYSMPVEVPLQTSLYAIRVISTRGVLPGGLQLLDRVLGTAAVDVLMDAPEVEDEHLLKIVDQVTTHVLVKNTQVEESEEALGE